MASVNEHRWITAHCSDPQDDAIVLCEITGKNENTKTKVSTFKVQEKYYGFNSKLENNQMCETKV